MSTLVSDTAPAPVARHTPDGVIRVLVVDDSAFMRLTLSKMLTDSGRVEVVGAARDGLEALEMIPRLNPDVVTLDVEMPRLDGLNTLRRIMTSQPRPVVMLSSLTTEGARETILALTWGAVDFISKPAARANIPLILDELLTKITQAASARLPGVAHLAATGTAQVDAPLPTPTLANPASPAAGSQRAGSKVTRRLRPQDRVVVIGTSTGGPRALNDLIPRLASDLPAAFLVVQHMPVGFTRSLAERLDQNSNLRVREAVPGDVPEVGQVLMAPGGFHMTLDSNGVIGLNQNPTIHGVRPAVDVTMISAAKVYGKATIGVILTGMGRDGTNGAALVRSAGGKVIAEDESTCVVWGMPRSVIEAGAADLVAPLNDIPAAISRFVNGHH